MDPDRKSRAESRLEAAFEAAGAVDSRAALRAVLKELRARSPDAFEQALASYEERVVPALADGPAVLDAWIGYGRRLGELLGEGRLLDIDAEGRASDHSPPYQAGTLVLFVPDDAATPAFALALPRSPSAAQAATEALIVGLRLGL
jgi:hypothetical protein